MKKIFTLILFSMIAFNTIHARITWTLTDDGTLTISGTDMPNYSTSYFHSDTPWFSQCRKVKNVVIRDGVTNIGSHAFYECDFLISISIPSSVTSIGDYAFYHCSSLKSVTLSNSVTDIGRYAFYGCTGLTSVIIPNSVTGIEWNAFDGCTGLTSVIIPNSVKYIDAFAFHNCSNLTSLIIPNSVKVISGEAFNGCSSLTSVTIPNSVTTIGTGTFGACISLKSIIVEEGNPKYDSRNDCNAIIETASNKLICGCRNTIIPNSVTTIAFEAFWGCSTLKSITIPKSVTNIHETAFANCSGLKYIICEANIPPVCQSSSYENLGCFKNVDKSIPLYVPDKSIDTYRAASQWKDFTNIQAIIEPASISFTNADEKLIVGMTTKLKATITPEDAMNKTITWSSSNTDVATVSSKGIVTAKGPGTTVITAKTYNEKIATYMITVEQPVTGIVFCEKTAPLWIGETKELTVEVTPTTASNTSVEWSSSDDNVATVSSEGVITANGEGTCIITCTAADGYGTKSTCEVTVKQQVTEIALSETTASLWVGDTKTITATASPKTASDTSVEWSSSDDNVASVSSDGVITANGEGTCIITCMAADGYGTKSTCEITVKQHVTEIALSETTASLWVGDTKTITATASPTTASNTSVTWSSSDDNVATVSSDGVITANGEGTCIITCTADDGYGTKSTCEVTVKQQVTEIALSETTASLWVGDTKTITATASPKTASDTSVIWSSSDDNVATVSSEGVITANGEGTCIITCTTADGYGTKSTCEVAVKQQVKEIALSETTASLWVGDTKTITATTSPITASNTSVTWSSSDDNVATVSSEGVITAKGKGTCIITCTAADGYGAKSTCEITVKQQVTEITLSETTASLWVGDTKTLTATTSPTTASKKAVKWSSSDDNVATVSSEGVITAKGKGTCIITCTAADGYGATSICEVTVMQQTTNIENSLIANDKSAIYNLNGQRINKAHTQKGIYIKNGKKYAK